MSSFIGTSSTPSPESGVTMGGSLSNMLEHHRDDIIGIANWMYPSRTPDPPPPPPPVLNDSDSDSDDDDDPHSPSIMYMIMNGQYFSATSMLMQVKKESVLTWMKQHYIYKGKNNGGLADLHNFISKDKDTSIMVSFMSMNESEYSTVTIAYQKEF